MGLHDMYSLNLTEINIPEGFLFLEFYILQSLAYEILKHTFVHFLNMLFPLL